MRVLHYFVLFVFTMMIVVPIAAQETTPVVSQRFEGGEMIYRTDTGDIYVISNVSGRWWFLPSSEYGQLPLNQITKAPDGLIAPIMGFGRIWANYPTIRNELGWAVLPEISLQMRFTKLSTGEFYLTRLNGQSLQLFDTGVWQSVSIVPDDKNLEITQFEASLELGTYGKFVNIVWQAKGSDLVQIQIIDTAHPDTIIESLWDETPDDGGNWTWKVPETVEGNIKVVLWLLNYNEGYQGKYFSPIQWLIFETRIVAISHDKSTYTETYAAFQTYEHGFMLWREDVNHVSVFHDDGTVTWVLSPTLESLSDNQWPTPEGCITPINAFGRVWGNYANIRDKVGCATSAELGFNLVITFEGNNVASFQLPDGRVIRFKNFNWWE